MIEGEKKSRFCGFQCRWTLSITQRHWLVEFHWHEVRSFSITTASGELLAHSSEKDGRVACIGDC